jgi:hypothetical protein
LPENPIYDDIFVGRRAMAKIRGLTANGQTHSQRAGTLAAIRQWAALEAQRRAARQARLDMGRIRAAIATGRAQVVVNCDTGQNRKLEEAIKTLSSQFAQLAGQLKKRPKVVVRLP